MSALALMLAAAAAAEAAPICTDRPTKANAVCTVPAGQSAAGNECRRLEPDAKPPALEPNC